MNYKTIDLFSNTEPQKAFDTFVALGDFDGVHIAHMRILKSAVSAAQALGALPCVWTFSSPSYKFSGTENGVLTTWEEKKSIFAAIGIQRVFIADFEQFRHMAPDTFIAYLKDELRCVGIACGYNFTFGVNKTGTPDLLKRAFPNTCVENEFVKDKTTVSSSIIRRFLAQGEAEKAAEYLGYPYAVAGTVSHGNGWGHGFGFPTANVTVPADKLLPKPGVYYTNCIVDGRVVLSVTDVGTKPTVSDTGEIICESFLIGWDGDLYGKEITVRFLKYIRPEKKFADTETLTAQIHADVNEAIMLSSNEERSP